MNFFQAIFLGLVQALTEYLPVSSSAHVRIVGDLMLGSDPGAAFTAIIQIGTELAVLLYFRHDIWNILKNWCICLAGKNCKDWKHRLGEGNKDARLGWYIIIATLPIVFAGLLFQDAIENTLRNLWITAAMLLVFGIILWIVDDRAPQVKTIDVPGNTNRILFAGREFADREAFAKAIDTLSSDDPVKKSTIKTFLMGTYAGLADYRAGRHILTDDKAPVELLGMRAIDQLVSEELAVYKEMYHEQGLQGIMEELL